MQQQVQINQSPERVLTDAAAFFAKRRTKITDRDPKGFRFGLEGADAREGGRVTVASGPGGGSTVTVQADGLGVMAIAEGFVRELRKHARSVDRRARTPARDVARGGFGDLRERLGMPEPVAQQRPPRGAAPAEPTARAPSDAAADAGPAAPREAAEAAAPPPAAAAAAETAVSAARPAHPDGPAPVEAPAISSAAGPRSAPGRPAPVEAPHPAFTGPQVDVDVPAADAPPATQALAGGAPSPEQMGAVPRPDDVPAAAAPAETAEAAEAGMGPEWRAKEQAPGTPTEPPTGP